MERVVKGILMELNDKDAVIMTRSGEFLKVKKPMSGVLPGEEITSTMAQKSRGILKYAAMAAAIILLLLPFGYYTEVMATVAYVNIDINPSLEVGINRYNRITDAIALNEDGESLLENISLKNLEIEKGVEAIIQGAEDMGFIREDKENNIEIALVKVKESQVNLSEESLLKCAKDTLDDGSLDATVKVNSVNKKDHDSAKKENMSTNKYLDKHEKQVEKSIKADIKKSNPNKDKKGKKDKKDDLKDKKDKNTKNTGGLEKPNVPGLNKIKENKDKRGPSVIDKANDEKKFQDWKEDNKDNWKKEHSKDNRGTSNKDSNKNNKPKSRR